MFHSVHYIDSLYTIELRLERLQRLCQEASQDMNQIEAEVPHFQHELVHIHLALLMN